MKTIMFGAVAVAVIMLFQGAPAGAFFGLLIFTVLVSIIWAFILQIAKRSPKQEHQYFVTPKDQKEYQPPYAHSNALDVASNPWVYGDEHDKRSHAYATKLYYEREAAARQMAYKKQVKRDEATRELNKWIVSDE
jgi:hypothetical protein